MYSTNSTSTPSRKNSHLRSLRRCMAAVLFSLDRMEDGTYQTLLTRRTIWPTGGIKTEESQCISSGGSKLSGPTSLNPCNRKTNSNLEQQSKMGLGACRYLLSWEKSIVAQPLQSLSFCKAQQNPI